MENEIDLFENPVSLPQEVQNVLEDFSDIEDYEGCQELIEALELIGYTCEYGLDAVPYGLRKID
jgi:hypothetical protein